MPDGIEKKVEGTQKLAEAKGPSDEAAWAVVGGDVLDVGGKKVRGLARVVEQGCTRREAEGRAKELGCRAMRGDAPAFAPVGVTRLAGPGPEPCQAAEVDADLSRKSVLAAGMACEEAFAEADRLWVEDGVQRAVVCALPARKGAVAAAVAACAAVVAIAVGCAAFLAGGDGSSVPAPAQQEAAEEASSAEVSVTLAAAGATDAPVKAEVEILDADGLQAIAPVAVEANERVVLGELPEGEYSLSVVSAPVLADGSTYRLPDGPEPFEVAGDGLVDVEVSLEPVAAADMTKEQLEAVADELEAAGRSDAAADARGQASAAPSVSGSAGAIVRDPGPSGSAASSGGGSSPSSGSSSGSASGGSSQPSQPAHQHTWVEQTSQQWVPQQVWVVDQAAWDEPVYEEQVVCSCGAVFDTTSQWFEHDASFGWGGSGHSYSVKNVQTDSIRHDEVGHYEDQGHYETVTTGYVCSGCGATK